MDFRNKYLKYKPEITFDIFHKVWDKLIENGYIPIGKYDVERGFGDFKTLYCYLRTTETQPMIFNCYSVIPALFWVETTVQEILGYDPFVNDDDFVLPERWCCKITEESIDVFNNWRISMSKHYLRNKIDKKYLYITNDGSCNYTTFGDEITLEQFKRHVLNQGIDGGIKMHYYKCIKSNFQELVFGKIYQSHDGKYVNIKTDQKTTHHFYVHDGQFELSTKYAFDLQNAPKQPIKQVVRCETQEQWDFVIEKVEYRLPKTDFNEYKSESCVVLNSSNHYGSLKWAAKENYQILSFSDWCAQNNYKFLSRKDKFMEVLRKNARTLGGEVAEISLTDYAELSKNMFYFGAKNVDDNLRNSIAHGNVTLQNLSKSVINYGLNDKNSVKISTDNEIKINIIQKQSIKI